MPTFFFVVSRYTIQPPAPLSNQMIIVKQSKEAYKRCLFCTLWQLVYFVLISSCRTGLYKISGVFESHWDCCVP